MLSVQVALTCVFAVSAVFYVTQIRRAASASDRVAGCLHILMAIGMIAMTWAWGMRISTIVYVLVFTACAFFFVHRALGRHRDLDFEIDGNDDDPVTYHHNWYHAAMMASMPVMAVLMTTPVTSASVHTSDDHAMSSMPGMASMGSMGGSTMSAGSHTPVWLIVVAAVVACAFLAAALADFYRSVQGPHRPVAELLMSAGMAVSFALMI